MSSRPTLNEHRQLQVGFVWTKKETENKKGLFIPFQGEEIMFLVGNMNLNKKQNQASRLPFFPHANLTFNWKMPQSNALTILVLPRLDQDMVPNGDIPRRVAKDRYVIDELQLQRLTPTKTEGLKQAPRLPNKSN